MSSKTGMSKYRILVLAHLSSLNKVQNNVGLLL